jgi:hypothetical protein
MADERMNDERQATDMSPEAIGRRLRDLGQLYRLGMSLRTAKYLGPVNGSVPPKSDHPSTLPSNEKKHLPS